MHQPSGTDESKTPIGSEFLVRSSKRYFSASSAGTQRNPGLSSVISQGKDSLEKTASDVQARTRKPRQSKSDGPGPRQIMEAQRIMDTATECLEDMSARGFGSLCIHGEPIMLVEVQVNTNLRLAKVYWTLPYGLLLDESMSKEAYRIMVLKMKENIESGGGAKLLQLQVHTRLRSYYPPRLRLLPATDEMIHRTLEELLDD